MRAYYWTLAIAVLLSFGAANAAAAGTPLTDLLQRLGILPPPPDADGGNEPSSRGAPPQVPLRDGGLLGDLGRILDLVGSPTTVVVDTLGVLGLGLVAGLFATLEEGGQTMAAAANSVANHPLQAGVAATLSLAIAGISLGLGALAQRYGGIGAIPLYSRIAKSELLENEVRQQIFELIRQNPGINVSQIARRLTVAWGTATHHLHKLRQERLVSIRIASNQKCYFPNAGSYTPHEMDVMGAVKHPTARRIAEFLLRAGPQCHGDISHALGLNPALVSFHIEKLLRGSVVARHRDGRRSIFTPLEPQLDPEPRPAAF